MTDTDKATDHPDFVSLAQLRDEIRVRLHLARMDAKEKWQELETQFSSFEHRVTADGGSLLGSSAQLAKDLKQSLVEFRQRLSHESEPEAPTRASSR